ncbi:MAG: hypothetical protein K2Q25_08850 [Mycobacteriaceae bacterium]|nr:hypothetical protein [Mycobacteriaceae bacterium]
MTIAIQRWGRGAVWRGRVLGMGSEPGRFRLAIPWQRQNFFTEALDLAVELIRRCLQPTSASVFVSLHQHFGERWESILANGLAPETLRFLQAGVSRGMPFDVLPSFVQLGWGANAERFDMSFTGRTGWMASALAHHKWKSKKMLADAGLPVPRGWLVSDVDRAEQAVENDIGWPVVIKPVRQELGLGVFAGIPDAETLRRVFNRTAQHSAGSVIVEKHIAGDDHRLLVVEGHFIAASRRLPGGVTGDGRAHNRRATGSGQLRRPARHLTVQPAQKAVVGRRGERLPAQAGT